VSDTTRESRRGLRSLPGEMRLRLWGRRLLATWLCLLRTRAERLDPAAPTSDPEIRQFFRAANRRRQEELHRVFRPYYRLCPGCGSACCREGEIPYSALDRLLYGIKPTEQTAIGGETVRDNRDYLSCFRRSHLQVKLRRFTRAENNGATFCPALAGSGCRLPWGERPAVCVCCACPPILVEMDWPAYGRYVWITLKYLAHLSLALRTRNSGTPIRADW
jgi:hypothetical protein